MVLLRYFSREVFLNTLAVATVLLLVFLSQRFVKYLGNAAAGEIDAAVLLPLISYRIPGLLELILPLALFIALLLVYGRLYLDNEMRVLFAAGISRWYLLLLTMVPVCLVAALVGWISLSISPAALARVQGIWQAQEDRSELDSLSAGKFHPFKDGSGVIYVEEVLDAEPVEAESGEKISGKRMKGVYVFLGDETGQGESVVVAERGYQARNADGKYLMLESGYRLRILDHGERFERVDFSRYGQQVEVQATDEYKNLRVNALPTSTLRGSSRPDYQAAWQWRVSLIALVPVVALLAIAFGKADARQGRYFKVLPAVLIYLVYLILLNMIKDKLASGVVLGINPFMLAHGAFGLLAIVLLCWEDFSRRYFDGGRS